MGKQDSTERERVKELFAALGVSVTEWATANGFKREQVYAVLNGRTTGRRGTAHRIAVALGIKQALTNTLMPSEQLSKLQENNHTRAATAAQSAERSAK